MAAFDEAPQRAMTLTASPLKLMALDTEDLAVLSAHVQDAVLQAADIRYLPAEQRFFIAMNRFNWDGAKGAKANHYERRRAVLHFERVKAVQSRNLDRGAGDIILNLLAVTFEETGDQDGSDGPDGVVTLSFSGGATIRLMTEYLEAMLSDTGEAWETGRQPHHEDDGAPAPGGDAAMS